MIKEAEQSVPTVKLNGDIIYGQLINGVKTKEFRNMITQNSVTTEIYRNDWGLNEDKIVHIIHVTLLGKAISAWHYHKKKTDRIFVTSGQMRLVLFDDREDSKTRQCLNVFNLSGQRPTFVSLPPNIWHGIQNLDYQPTSFINHFDGIYEYDDPDDWRLPYDTDKIQYDFTK